MSTNFTFLKPVDKNLFEIISDAEKLYRDEYFEQCMGQTRRFAESICKNVLGERYTGANTFDEMLATLKDKSKGSIQEREFIDDLYFLKREGNNSVHSENVKNSGMVALECLQRAFELSINYAVYYQKAKSNLLKLQYDTELLITGKKVKKTLKEKYEEEKVKASVELEIKNTKSKKSKTKQTKAKTYNKPKFPIFKWFLMISCIISVVIILTIFLLSLV